MSLTPSQHDTKNRINNVRSELRSIVSELEQISHALRTEFKGIGSELCSDRIDDAVKKYKKAITKLDNVDVNRIEGAIEALIDMAT